MRSQMLGLLALGLLAGPTGANGAVVTYDFTGWIGEVADGPVFAPISAAGVGLNAGAVGSFSYDTAASGQPVPGFTIYAGAIKSFALNVGGGQLVWNPVSLSDSGINIINNSSVMPTADLFAGRVLQNTVAGLTPPGAMLDPSAALIAGINLGADALFDDESLPPSLDFAKFAWRTVRLFPQLPNQPPNPANGFLAVELTSLTLRVVPEPGTLALLGLGLAGLGVMRRRKES